jgi:PAS domain S-box-containing protein
VVVWILVLTSLTLQLAAAAMAVRLIWVTGRRWAWGLIATAILLMVVRRVVALSILLSGASSRRLDVVNESVGLVISLCMFVGLAWIAPVFLDFRRAQQTISHLNGVLRALRGINQLVAREHDRDRLLQGVCASLVDGQTYRHAWLALLDSSSRVVTAVEAGLGTLFAPIQARLARGEFPACMQRALASPGGAVFGSGAADCGDCPLRSRDAGGRAMAVQLTAGGGEVGVLVTCLPHGVPTAAEEKSLLEEAASDISFALSSIRREAERQRAEKHLRLDESRLEALVRQSQMAEATLQQLTDFALEEAVRLTESKIGYLAFVNPDETVLTMHSWSKTAMAECQIVDKPIVYQVAATGLWGEAVRQRRPVITNDYPAPNPWKKGYPDGHVHVTRHMNVPIFEGERIVLVAGVGNKEEAYDEADVRQLTLLMQGMWRLVQRRQAEEEIRQAKRRLEDIIEFLPDATFVVDQEHRVIAWNRAMEEMTGVRKEAILGRGDFAYALPFYGERHPMVIDLLDTPPGEIPEHYERFEPRHNTVFAERYVPTLYGGRGAHVFIAATPLLDAAGRRSGAIESVRDITDRKHAEEELRKAYDELEQRVAQRTAELANANAELLRSKEAAEAASRAKSTFLANMSHEIRTPLNAVIGMTELVLNSQLTHQQREFLTTVRDSGEALLSVINDVLDFSKIEAGKLHLDSRPFDLWESLGDTMKSFALRAHQQQLELAYWVHPDVPRRLQGDYGRLRQVVVNLVGNAIKFTERGEVVVEVSRQSLSATDTVLHVCVRDTGIGIPADKRAAIFEMFEQADASMTRRHGGTGLGLAIAARLVEMMGGRIWVESEPGEGSQFHFTVRLELADPTHPVAPSLAPACLRGMQVLIVDDNATNRHILAELARSWEMVPIAVRGADEAIAILRQASTAGAPCPLVLTDAHMPRVDGFMLVEQIKQEPSLGSTVVIMLTSGDHPEDAQRCRQLGIAAYLLKPVKQSELLEAIQAALGLQALAGTPETAPEAVAAPARHIRVLLAEDSLFNQRLAVALLEGQQHVVTVVNNGQEAVRAVTSQTFDLVLMDVQMPIMDGLEAATRIRAHEREAGGHVPIVAMTAHALKGDRERCLEAGMDDYVPKPIRARELFACIERLFAPAHNNCPTT